MQGKLNTQDRRSPCQVVLEDFVPKNHLLRKLDKLVDLGFVRELTKEKYCQTNGRPSVDPELFFRMMIVHYLYGIKSERRLCEDIHCHLAYRWFCKLSITDKVPHHSSISKIRDRLGESIFEDFFNYIIEVCKDHGLVSGRRIMTDGTLIEANASLNSMVLRDKGHTSIIKVETESEKPKRPLSNKTHISSTDPDSSLARKSNSKQGLKYKSTLTIDAETRIIIDNAITTGSLHDSEGYLERLTHIEKNVGITIQEAIADRAYGTAKILDFFKKKETQAFIPLFSNRSGNYAVNEQHGFIYEEENDVYRCSEGNYLKPYSSITSDTRRYASDLSTCTACKKEEHCPARPIKTTGRRYLFRNIYQSLYDDVKEKMKTCQFKKVCHERLWKIEGLISEAKYSHNLGRAFFRGRKKVQIQAFLSSSSQNLKRLIAYCTSKAKQKFWHSIDTGKLKITVIFRIFHHNLLFNNSTIGLQKNYNLTLFF